MRIHLPESYATNKSGLGRVVVFDAFLIGGHFVAMQFIGRVSKSLVTQACPLIGRRPSAASCDARHSNPISCGAPAAPGTAPRLAREAGFNVPAAPANEYHGHGVATNNNSLKNPLDSKPINHMDRVQHQ